MDNAKVIEELSELVSEGRNPNTMNLDSLNTEELVAAINNEDSLVAHAVADCQQQISACVDEIVSRITNGGRLIYIGAGTSGRLGILDAVECVPTFSVPQGLVIGLIAGGSTALTNAAEGAEDRTQAAIEDLQQIELNEHDIVIGIAASGRTPYVIAGLEHAASIGCATACIVCNPNAPMLTMVNFPICAVVGPECVTGSTRMKSGTAQKLILNTLSTASMVRLGKVYENLMVDVKVTNRKLMARAIRIVMQATKCSAFQAETMLKECGMNAKQAICALTASLSPNDAKLLLAKHKGHLKLAIDEAKRT